MKFSKSLIVTLTLGLFGSAVAYTNPTRNPGGADPFITKSGDGYYYLLSTDGVGLATNRCSNTLIHAVNNYWYDNTGHAFDIGSGSMVVAEGNVFQNVKATINSGRTGQLFGSPDSSSNAKYSSYLGHTCQVNGYGSSPALGGGDSRLFCNFQGKNIASASTYDAAKSVANTAGFGTI